MNLKKITPLEEIFTLKEEIKKHNTKYYLENSPEISDSEFDLLNKRLYKLLKDHPEISKDFSDLDLLGSKLDLSENKKKPHIKPMFSLQNIFDFLELIEFDKRIYRFFNFDIPENYEIISNENFDNFKEKKLESKFEYCIEQKFDGLSFSALYIDGKFENALTRGDGFIGEDISQNILGLIDWPKELLGHFPKKIEIRGEVFMPIQKFEELNQELESRGEKKFVNPRNAASGSLRVLDKNEASKRGLRYFAYSIGFVDWGELKSSEIPRLQSELVEFLKNLGFKTSNFVKTSNDLIEIYKIYLEVLEKRHSLDFEIDGIVLKINQLDSQEKLGQTGKYPRWAAAFKFPSNEGVTRILDVNFSIGRTGAITPVAHIKPLNLGGATISKASLHNFHEIKRLGIMINDLIILKRSGDVIPQITQVLKEKRIDDKIERKEIEKPERCPSCGSKIFEHPGEVVLRCENFNCEAKTIEYIKYFCSRDAMNITGLGDKQVIFFFNNKFIQNPIDIFFLEERFAEKIEVLPNWGRKSASNLFASIEKSKDISFSKFIYSLGVRFNGEMNSKVLAKYFKNIEGFLNFIESFEKNSVKKTKDDYIFDLNQIDGLGEKTVFSLVFFLERKENRDFIKNLSKILRISNDIFEVNKNQNNSENIFFEKNIVFTGTLTSLSRQAAKEIAVKSLGANVQSSITKNSDYLIFGEGAGSKLQKALEIPKIKLCSEDEFLKILEKLNINF